MYVVMFCRILLKVVNCHILCTQHNHSVGQTEYYVESDRILCYNNKITKYILLSLRLPLKALTITDLHCCHTNPVGLLSSSAYNK